MTVRILAARSASDSLTEPSIAVLPDLLGSEDAVVWVDLAGEGEEEQNVLSDIFKFHPLIIEDAFADATHPKLEEFDDYVYLIVRGLDADAEEPRDVQFVELDVFIGKNFVVTHHSKRLRSIEQTMADMRRNPKSLRRGAAWVAHQILDKLVDLYLPLMSKFDEELETLEHEVIKGPHANHLQQIFDLKGSLQRIRRVAIHQKEVLGQLAKGDLDFIPEPSLPFFRDVYDHFVRVTDLGDSFRDLVSAVLTAYMSQQQARLNEVMKVLTLISTIMLPLTFIAGIYGMNFDPDYSPWNMPELRWFFGYPFALVLMAITASILVYYFRRKKWI